MIALFTAGLGDVIRVIHRQEGYLRISSAVEPVDVITASHNPFAAEIFRHHRNAGQFRIHELGHKYVEFLESGLRGPAIHDALLAFSGLSPDQVVRGTAPAGYLPQFHAPDEVEGRGHLVFCPFAGAGPRTFTDAFIERLVRILKRLPVQVYLVCRSFPRANKSGRLVHAQEDGWRWAGGNIQVLDNLTVPASLNLVRNASAYVGSWSSLHQAAWFEDKPVAVFYPPKWGDVENRSGYAFGLDRPDCYHSDYQSLSDTALEQWLWLWALGSPPASAEVNRAGLSQLAAEATPRSSASVSSLTNSFMLIPRIIHQTWKDAYPHPALSQCISSFTVMNPNWNHRFYSDEDCERWVSEKCPEVLPTYIGFKTGIHRADFFRILVLFVEGGLYADIDIECLRPLDELLSRLPQDKTLYLTRDHPVHERVHFGGRAMWMNDFMIAAPGDPFLKEVIDWLVASPVSSGSANAVMETGPGVLSAVMEMLGGPEMVPSLGTVPVPWIHPLPDMNCNFPERKVYQQMILNRGWLGREAFVVHYWFHTWVSGADTNTLTDYADTLLSSPGEQLERKLQWLLRDSTDERELMLAAALTELVEGGMELVLHRCDNAPEMVQMLIGLLHLTGIRPRVWLSDTGNTKALAVLGASSLQRWPGGNVLVVADPSCDVSGLPEDFSGWVVGPVAPGSAVLQTAGNWHWCETWEKRHIVPMVLHLLPKDAPVAEAVMGHVHPYGVRCRLWNQSELEELLRVETRGQFAPRYTSVTDLQTAAALIVLQRHGGFMFEGDSRALGAHLKPLRRPSMHQSSNVWWFACEPGCPLLDGALEHWQQGRLRSRAHEPAELSDRLEHVPANIGLGLFLQRWLRKVQHLGRGERLDAAISSLSSNASQR
jgi:Glycosyltransferase sugar-binding region containing DXD motif